MNGRGQSICVAPHYALLPLLFPRPPLPNSPNSCKSCNFRSSFCSLVSLGLA